MKRSFVRVAGTLIVLTAAIAYILAKIDVHRTVKTIGDADLGWLAVAVVLILFGTAPMAWRWKVLLDARGVYDRFRWLLRSYFVSLAVGQVLPTSVGGDASRIYETIKRHPRSASTVAGSVLMERAIGGGVTLLLAGVGFLLAIGRYSIGAYLWLEVVCILGAFVLAVVFLSRRFRRQLTRLVPLTRRMRIEAPARAVYEGVHGYRTCYRAVGIVMLATIAVQVVGLVSIYAVGRAVGIRLSFAPYVVLGPLLFLITLVPFTINGLAVREAFFVSFLGNLGVPHETAFACGFLVFLTTVLAAVPGLAVLFWEHLGRRVTKRRRSALLL